MIASEIPAGRWISGLFCSYPTYFCIIRYVGLDKSRYVVICQRAEEYRLKWFRMNASGHHGYPQPEDTYLDATYSKVCLRCGIRSAQVSPFRVRPTLKAGRSHFLQLNWEFDSFFVTREVARQLESSPSPAMSFGPIVNHKSGANVAEWRQLLIPTVIDCVEASELPVVTCRPNNEEAQYDHPGAKRYPDNAPYCGRIKRHPPTSVVVDPTALVEAPDIVLSEGWFGSGGSAFRLTLCSEAFVDVVRSNSWRGLSFTTVSFSGCSARAT